MKIVQWNINGLLNNYVDLDLILHEYSPEIVCLQETHIPHSKTAHAPNKYLSYFSNNPNNKTCKQGVAMFVKKSLSHKFIPIASNIQSVAVEVDIGFKITIITCYIPPEQPFSSTEILNLINPFLDPIILLGDFNGWSPLWGSPTTNNRGKIIEDVILAKNLVILNDGFPTHFSTHRSFSHPDISISSSSIAPKLESKTLSDLHNSDHYPIVTSLSMPQFYRVKPKPKFITERADWETFCSNIIHLSSKKPESHNVNKEAFTIKSLIRSAANISIPQTCTKKFSAKLPYWSNLLSILRKTKQSSWAEYKRTRSNENLVKYKKANACFRRELKASKRQALETLTASITPSSSPKKIWSDIKYLTSSCQRNHIPFIHSPEGPIYSPKEIADKFAITWSNYSHSSNFHPDFSCKKSNIVPKCYHNSSPSYEALCLDSRITLEEFNLTLSSLSGKTPGSDRITYNILKNLPFALKSRVVNLYNSILEQGTFPQSWKIAAIIPIPKPNKPNSLISNFRPISLLPCISKVFEKIIARRLAWFAQQNNLLSPNQFAFQKNLGVIDPLLIFENFASTALANRNHVSVLSIDFEKAYDRIGSHVVLEELSRWKVGEKIYKVIRSYLCNRKFFVRVNNNESNILPLFNGIPQGSPLSVILFIIAFKEVSSIISLNANIEHFAYADDVLIFSKTSDLTTVKNSFTDILSKLELWSKSSGASMSINKSSTFHICRKHKCTFPSISFSNVTLPHTNTLKVLGIIFDKKLTYKHHCEHIRISLLSRLNIIKYLSSKHCLVHTQTLVNITRALMLSKIDFGLAIYGHCAYSHLKRLEAPYHAAARRSIRAFPTSPIYTILAEAGLPTLVERVSNNTLMCIPRVLYCRNKLLFECVSSCQHNTSKNGRKSTISEILNQAKELNILISPILVEKPSHPEWIVPSYLAINNLMHHQKNITGPDEFKQLYLETVSPLKSDWDLLFTDGSKTDTCTSFAVTNEIGTTITVGVLPSYCSIFTAEAAASLEAVHFASQKNHQYIICSDSKSTIEAILNPANNSPVITKMRNMLTQKKGSIKLMWVPGHSGIKGNEQADSRAKEATKEPLYMFEYTHPEDIKKLVRRTNYESSLNKWNQYQHHYKSFNLSRSKNQYPSNSSCQNIKTVVRLRIGHTISTHSYLLNGLPKPPCPFCGFSEFTVSHFMDICSGIQNIRSSVFKNIKPSELLKQTTDYNISIINQFVSCCKLKI